MRSLKIILLLSFIFFLSGCSKKIIEEKEPNNSFAHATSVTTEKTIEGYMNTTEDRDVYSLTVTDPGILDISLSGLKGINLAVQVWHGKEEPVIIKTIDDSRKSSPERMVNLKVDTGSWYIVILHGERDRKRSNIKIPYSLKLSIRDFIDEEIEPNDFHTEATEITFDREVSGYFSPAYNRKKKNGDNPLREEDWFVLTTEESLETPLVVDIQLTEVNGINSFLELYDTSMNLIAKIDQNPAGFPEILKGIGLKEPGKYYLLVSTKTFQSSSELPYTLKVSGVPYDPSAELEPNDSIEKAGSIIDSTVKGSVNHEGDIDFFKYNKSDVTSLYRIEVTNESHQGEVYLKIFNKDKKEVIRIDNKSGDGMEIHPDLHIAAPFYCGIYWKKAAKDGSGNYTFSIENIKDYKNMEIEPNNRIEDASIVSGDTATGYISTRDDKDYFLVKTKNDRRSRFKFLVKGVAQGEIKIDITDPMGYTLKSIKVSGDEEKEVLETIDKKGYIVITPLRENYDSPYTIYITEVR